LIEQTDIQLSNNDLHRFYVNYFHYYNTLSPSWQKKFIERTIHFICNKNIVGAEGFVVNNKVKAIVAASAVQLTLGLTTWDYDYFFEIIIHPKVFTNKATNQQFKGETNLRGYMQFSWLSFIKGYENLHDNINLGIHEFSHALRFNSIRGNEEDYYAKYFFVKWLGTAYEAHYHLKQGKESIFREYGGANINEFISVCFEHYFESPLQIKSAYPHLFYNTAILLNQLTSDEKTEVNIREQMMIEKNKLLTPLTKREISQSVSKSTSLPLIVATLVLYFTTAFSAGFFSGPALTLLAIAGLFYLRLEVNHVAISIEENKCAIKKGFYFLKNWQKHDILLSQVVNLTCSETSDETELTFIYYNFKDQHFYEESLECDTVHVKGLVQELKANKIAINRTA